MSHYNSLAISKTIDQPTKSKVRYSLPTKQKVDPELALYKNSLPTKQKVISQVC
jgi:hypothetical protein